MAESAVDGRMHQRDGRRRHFIVVYRSRERAT